MRKVTWSVLESLSCRFYIILAIRYAELVSILNPGLSHTG